MVQFITLSPVFLCVMGLLSETRCSLTLEAEAGDTVTIWGEHDLTVTGHIFWFKQTCDSVPLIIGCKKFRTSAPAGTCLFFTESERIVMSVYDKNTSLTITAVNVSDTGLYYCSYTKLDQVKFSTSTSLHVKGNEIMFSEDKAAGSDSPAVFFMLTLVFGAVIVILLSVLIFIILKHRKTHTGVKDEDNEVNDKDLILQSSSKTNKRRDEKVETHVVFSPVGGQ